MYLHSVPSVKKPGDPGHDIGQFVYKPLTGASVLAGASGWDVFGRREMRHHDNVTDVKTKTGGIGMSDRKSSVVFAPGRIGELEVRRRLVRSPTFERLATTGRRSHPP